MSVQPRPWPEIPEQTVAVARAAFPKGTLAMRVRDELPGLFVDEQFVSAFGVRGKPGISPGQLALVTVLQFVENLTDRQTADAVRGRIDWKYALGLELTDPGFDHTVLTGFRQRLINHGLEEIVLDILLTRLSELGVVKAGGRQRTDSTHVLAAVRSVNRLEFLAETLRAALEALAIAAPDWLAPRVDAEWVARYHARADSYRLPKGDDKRTAMVVQVGSDGFDLLGAVHADDAPPWLREVPAVVVLRSSSCGLYGSRSTTARSPTVGRRWPGGRTKTSRPAETGSARRMTQMLDTRPSAAVAGKATKSTSARVATMRPSPTCRTSSRTSPPPTRPSPMWRCWNRSTPASAAGICFQASTSWTPVTPPQN